MKHALVGIALAMALATSAGASISVDKLAARQHGQAVTRQALARQAKDQSALPPQSPTAATPSADTSADSSTPTASPANTPSRPVDAAPIREASAAGPWSPTSALPSSRDLDSILPPDDTYTTHGTGTRPPPPLGRTWDPSRETYSEWYARVIQGTDADPGTYPTSGGPTTGNSSTTPTGGTNQWGDWSYDDDVHVVGRVLLPNGTSPGVGFAVYIVPVFLNPPFPIPAIHTYTDADGYFYADLWAQGVWCVTVTRNAPENEPRLAYFDFTYDRMYAGDEPNTLIMVTRLAGSWR